MTDSDGVGVARGRRAARRAGARPRARRRSRGSRRPRRAAAAGPASDGRPVGARAAPRPRRACRWSSGTPAGSVPVDLERAAAGDERGRAGCGRRTTSGSTLAVLDRLEQEARARRRPARANAATGVVRSASTSRHTGTTVWSRASARNSSAIGPESRGVTPKARKKQERSPVWQAPLPSCSTTNSSVSPSQS